MNIDLGFITDKSRQFSFPDAACWAMCNDFILSLQGRNSMRKIEYGSPEDIYNIKGLKTRKERITRIINKITIPSNPNTMTETLALKWINYFSNLPLYTGFVTYIGIEKRINPPPKFSQCKNKLVFEFLPDGIPSELMFSFFSTIRYISDFPDTVKTWEKLTDGGLNPYLAFILSNCCPGIPHRNQPVWAKIESKWGLGSTGGGHHSLPTLSAFSLKLLDILHSPIDTAKNKINERDRISWPNNHYKFPASGRIRFTAPSDGGSSLSSASKLLSTLKLDEYLSFENQFDPHLLTSIDFERIMNNKSVLNEKIKKLIQKVGVLNLEPLTCQEITQIESLFHP